MQIKVKILLIITISILIVGIVVASSSIYLYKKTIRAEKFNQLTAIRDAKKQHIKNYFQHLESLLVSTANNHTTLLALNEFDNAIKTLHVNTKYNQKELSKSIKEHYEKEYTPRINNNIPNINKFTLEDLIPSSLVALVLQEQYIVFN